MPSILLLFLGNPSTDRRVQSFVRYFGEQGWSVELVATAPSSAAGPRRFWSYDRRAKKAVRERKADVVMACDLYSLGAAVRMKNLKRARRVIYDAREVYTELPTVTHRPLVKLAWKRYERRYLDDVDIMLVTGPHDADAIRRVHNGVPHTVLLRNLPWKDDTLTKDRARLREHGIDGSQPVLIYVGGMQEGRALRPVVRAMQHVSADLLLLGDGVLMQELRALVNSLQLGAKVHFAGSVDSDEALRIAAACDVGVSIIEPISESYKLALPSKLFEYMMAGLVVVTSELLQVDELFAGEEWLTVAKPVDEQHVAVAFSNAIALSTRQALGERARSLALGTYHFSADARGLHDILNALLELA